MSLQRNIATGYDFFNGLLVELGERSVTQLRFVAKPDAAVYCQQMDPCSGLTATLWLPVQQSCHEANRSVITFGAEDVPI